MTYAEKIINWYEQNKRDLPWRECDDPYKIWISEIILQQTQVVQGLPYFNRFVEHFPDVLALANAPEQDVLKYWQGLGYYSRARNLHTAAQTIRDEFGGNFPDNYEDIRKLKGIGDYTAAAISSFAYGINKAVVDGNVYRVLSRSFSIDTPIDTNTGKKEFAELAQQLIEGHNPTLYNQGIMDLGATICTPKSPNCEECPINDVCAGRSEGTYKDLPIKSKKVAVRQRYLYYIQLSLPNDKTVIRQRGEGDIWQGLFDFPLIESEREISPEDILQTDKAATFKNRCLGLSITHISSELKHQLTHQTLHAYLIKANAESIKTADNETIIDKQDISTYPLPRLMELLLEKK